MNLSVNDLPALLKTRASLSSYERVIELFSPVACWPRHLWNWISGASKPRSVLASHINLPFWVASSLVLSLVCNFALRENTAQAARLMGSHVSVVELQDLLRQMPDSYLLHVRLGDAHAEEGNFRRAMFHFQEANRVLGGIE